MGATAFRNHENDAASTIAAPGKASGATTFAVAAGAGAAFAPTHGRVSLVQAGGFDPATGRVTDKTKKAVYTYESVSGDTFSGVAVQAPYADLVFAAGDLAFDAADWSDVAATQAAVNALEVAPAVAPGGADGQVQFNSLGAFAGLPEFAYQAGTNGLALTPTWNNAAATFNAITVNVNKVAAANASLLLNLQAGGATKFSVDANGFATAVNIVTAPGFTTTTKTFYLQNAGLMLAKTAILNWSNSTIYDNVSDTTLSLAAPGAIAASGALGVGSLAVQTPTTGGTIAVTAGSPAAYFGQIPVNPAGAVTGAVLAAGTAAIEVTVVNRSAFSVTFAASGSNVSTGSACVVAANSARKFQWDAGTSLWYPTS